jgi:hypothetical protein
MIHDTAIALSIVALTAAMLYMFRVDNRRKAEAEAEEYERMRDRHIGNAIAAMHLSYNAAPERAASGNPETRAQDIRNARARYLLAQYRRDGLPY